MNPNGPRVILVGGTYRALCVLERLIERGERVVAFIGQEGGGERDFCPEILEICARHTIPARSARKFGEEIVRWLEDRIRPDLAISVGVNTELPLAVGGNCRLGLLEIIDFFHSEGCPGIVLRQRGQSVAERILPQLEDHEEVGEAYLRMVEEMLDLLDGYLDRLTGAQLQLPVRVPFEASFLSSLDLERVVSEPECGVETDLLEAEAAAYLEADRVLALGSATHAFRLLFDALELGEDDEVICSAISSCAAVDEIRQRGAIPVFADVLPDCLTMNPDHVSQLIGPRTRCLLISHPFGQPAQLDVLYHIAEDAELEVLEDAGAALGARFEGSRLGRSPCSCVFRLPLADQAPAAQPILVSLPEGIASRLGAAAQECRLGNGAAAVARRRLASWNAVLSTRRSIGSRYSSELVRYDAFCVPRTPEDRLPSYGSYALRVTGHSRTSAEDLHKLLNETGIETRLLTLPPTERDFIDLPVADRVRNQLLLLPAHSQLDDDQIDFTLDATFGFAIG
jgi:perosamine synthetase